LGGGRWLKGRLDVPTVAVTEEPEALAGVVLGVVRDQDVILGAEIVLVGEVERPAAVKLAIQLAYVVSGNLLADRDSDHAKRVIGGGTVGPFDHGDRVGC
jgi:hypothetical protein